MLKYDAVVVGSGLSGSVLARYLAEKNLKVLVMERRNHIGGNMYDYVNNDGIIVHKYGPHTFHTKHKYLMAYMQQYCEWEEYKLTCGAVIDGKYTPTPFNFQTVDDFFCKEKAENIKEAFRKEYPNKQTITVIEALESSNELIKEYATFLFEKDYSLYTAKQWGVSPKEIDSSILKRVPLRLDYEVGYFEDEYQVMPKLLYQNFFLNILKHTNIQVQLEVNALEHITLDEKNRTILINGKVFEGMLVYTGAIDELFLGKYGELPYRSLKFEWKTDKIKSYQNAPVVAYPQAEKYTRITEYTKLPIQEVGEKTTYAIEYSLPYKFGEKNEPYYPVLTEKSQEKYSLYKKEALEYKNLFLCGRLADFKYYNMDYALERALEVCNEIDKFLTKE